VENIRREEKKQESTELVDFSGKIAKNDRVKALYSLDALDKKLCEIIYEHPSVTYTELAALTNTTSHQVKFRLTKPAVKRRLSDMRISKSALMERAKVLGLRKLAKLVGSQDEWIALQACKVLLHGELAAPSVKISAEASQGVVYEVQIGAEGQVFQTMVQSSKAPKSVGKSENFPDVIDVVASLKNQSAE